MFEKNSTVCFLGDSITSNGRWIYEILGFLKNDNIKVFNCGRSGSGALEGSRFITEECFIHSPQYVVVMFGMNDVNLGTYKRGDKEQQEAALFDYRANLRRICDMCESYGAKVILCSPTPYNDVDDFAEENLMGNIGLVKITEIVRKLAEEKNCKFIDFHTPMSALLGKDDITNDDRKHPNSHGEHIMAQIFLKEIDAINTMDFSGKYSFSPVLYKVFDVSNILRGMAFTKRSRELQNALSLGLTIEKRKEIVRKMYDAEKNKADYVPRMYKIYIDSIDYEKDYEALYMEKMLAFLNS